MRVFVLFFVCLSCFAEDNDSWLCGAWSRVNSGASYLIGALNPCAQDSVWSSACGAVGRATSKVHQGACDWWSQTSRSEKVIDLFLAATFVGGVVTIGGFALPALADYFFCVKGLCSVAETLTPNCYYVMKSCSSAESSVLFLKFYSASFVATLTGWCVLTECLPRCVIKKLGDGSKFILRSTAQEVCNIAECMCCRVFCQKQKGFKRVSPYAKNV